MTRDQAIYEARQTLSTWTTQGASDIVDLLAALGLLKLETADDDANRDAAASCLSGTYVHGIKIDGGFTLVQISPPGAVEIIDVLLKSGFKITRVCPAPPSASARCAPENSKSIAPSAPSSSCSPRVSIRRISTTSSHKPGGRTMVDHHGDRLLAILIIALIAYAIFRLTRPTE